MPRGHVQLGDLDDRARRWAPIAQRKGEKAEKLINGLRFEITPVSLASAQGVAQAYRHWGNGVHLAGLNFGDCFAYDLARTNVCSLLFVGNGFSRTDIEAAG